MLRTKLIEAREARGWSVGKAAGKTVTVHHFVLRKLEAGVTDPAKCSAETMVDLLRLYDPDLQLSDFVGEEVAGYLVSIKKRPHRGRPRKDDPK